MLRLAARDYHGCSECTWRRWTERLDREDKRRMINGGARRERADLRLWSAFVGFSRDYNLTVKSHRPLIVIHVNVCVL
jgi:hypothetical protein